MQATDSPLPAFVDRVDRLRAALAKAKTYQDTDVALSQAGLAELRAVEPEYYPIPAPATRLRSSLADAHMVRALGEQATDTTQVDTDMVRGWVSDTLREWLHGHTDFVPAQGGQYVIAIVGVDDDTDGLIIRVSTPDGADPRHFMVRAEVSLLDEEVPA